MKFLIIASAACFLSSCDMGGAPADVARPESLITLTVKKLGNYEGLIPEAYVSVQNGDGRTYDVFVECTFYGRDDDLIGNGAGSVNALAPGQAAIAHVIASGRAHPRRADCRVATLL